MTRSELFRQMPCTLRSAFGLARGAVLLIACMTLASMSAVAQFATPTQLSLVNGWSDAGFTTSHAMVEEANGIVELRGSIEGGTTGAAFTLPAGYRPATDVYVPIDLCNAVKGRLIIQSTGAVTVQAEKSFTDAQCFTSLDGASFAVSATGYTPLTLINGWTNAPFGTSNAAFKNIAGGVHFKGAIATTGTNPVPFNMPAGVRPLTDVYIPIDLCNATNGRLHITPTGVVTVQAETSFSNAQCFTSLDGASFYGCTFRRCKLIFSGLLPFTLEGGSYHDCNWEFAGPAANTIAFLSALHKAGAHDLIEGTFRTIRGEQATSPITMRH